MYMQHIERSAARAITQINDNLTSVGYNIVNF